MTTEATTPVPDEERESYAFIMNVLELTDGESYELAPGHVLRRATSDEIGVIKNTIKRFVGLLHTSLMERFWEYKWPHQGGTYEQLPEEAWRYYVIAFRDTNVTLNSFRLQWTSRRWNLRSVSLFFMT